MIQSACASWAVEKTIKSGCFETLMIILDLECNYNTSAYGNIENKLKYIFLDGYKLKHAFIGRVTPVKHKHITSECLLLRTKTCFHTEEFYN